MSVYIGWFNGSNSWIEVPLYHEDNTRSFSSDRRLPAFLTGPRYVISTIDRLHDVRKGSTICGDFLKEDCEERLPDAKYIFRVTGALSKLHVQNNSHWFFCGVHGNSMTELEFELKHGKCHPGAKVTAHELCYETPLIASFVGKLTLSNVRSDSFSELDTTLLENDIAESVSSVVPGLHGAVVLDSVVVSGSDLEVAFTIQFDPIVLGLSGVHYNDMEKLAEQLGAAASSFADSGSFLKFMKSGLLSMPAGFVDILSSATAVTVSDIEYKGTAVHGTKSAGVVSAVEPTAAYGELGVSEKSVLASFQKSMLLLGVALCGVVLVVYVSGKLFQQVKILGTASSNEHGELLTGEDSSRDFANTGIDVSERTPNWN